MIKEVDIGSEVAIPEQLLKGCSDSVVAFVADDGNHFTDYGIFEGMILFFDTKKSFEKGRLSCYVNEQDNDQPKYKVSDKDIACLSCASLPIVCKKSCPFGTKGV